MFMTGQQYIRRLYRFLDADNVFKLSKLRNEAGYTYVYGTPAVIVLDFRDDLLATLIHEFLHHEHPTWGEDAILKLERKVVNSLTKRQALNVLKRLVKKLKV